METKELIKKLQEENPYDTFVECPGAILIKKEWEDNYHFYTFSDSHNYPHTNPAFHKRPIFLVKCWGFPSKWSHWRQLKTEMVDGKWKSTDLPTTAIQKYCDWVNGDDDSVEIYYDIAAFPRNLI